MPVINPFATDAFDMVALTAAINKIPNTYGRLEQLGLMPPPDRSIGRMTGASWGSFLSQELCMASRVRARASEEIRCS